MTTSYHYVVVTINGGHYFINKDMDYTDNFNDVLRFEDYDSADDFVKRKNLAEKDARIVEVIDNG